MSNINIATLDKGAKLSAIWQQDLPNNANLFSSLVVSSVPVFLNFDKILTLVKSSVRGKVGAKSLAHFFV